MSDYMPFQELVDVLGEADALKLCAALGGTRVYVPAKMTPRSKIVEVIGQDAAQTLADHVATEIGGLRVMIARGPTSAWHDQRRALAAAVADPSLTATEIARRCRTTHRAVTRMRAKLRKPGSNPKQGRLF